MNKKIIASLLMLFVSLSWLGAAVGDWRIHNSYRYATNCCVVGDKVYVLSAGNL